MNVCMCLYLYELYIIHICMYIYYMHIKIRRLIAGTQRKERSILRTPAGQSSPKPEPEPWGAEQCYPPRAWAVSRHHEVMNLQTLTGTPRTTSILRTPAGQSSPDGASPRDRTLPSPLGRCASGEVFSVWKCALWI